MEKEAEPSGVEKILRRHRYELMRQDTAFAQQVEDKLTMVFEFCKGTNRNLTGLAWAMESGNECDTYEEWLQEVRK